MENTTVMIKFDQEKTDALRVYLGHKDSCVEAEIEKLWMLFTARLYLML